MPLTSLFKLSKFTVAGYSDDQRQHPLPGISRMEMQYNPETLSMKHESGISPRRGIATSSAHARYTHSRSEELSVKLIFDGSRVDAMGFERLRHSPTVQERVKRFLRLCYQVNSATHEPSYLKLLWGKGVLGDSFDCRLKSVDIQYHSFDRDGSPLYAELDAVFLEDVDDAKKASIDRLSSPDLTHRRVVRAGDTLPLLCQEIYG
ncbi:MAG TPA: hypothetical protein PKW90_15900, partial [Myxococcota bacterium]|nr:hypothetical protein [Myxococcota bacterium]